MTPRYYCWRDSLRLRKGLHWKGASPKPSDCPGLIRSILLIAFILAAAVLSMAIADALYEAGDAIREAKEAQAMLTDCLNGKPVGYVENKTGYGHGRTYITCKVEEINV